MRQNLVFALGSRSRYLLPGIQRLFTVFKPKPRNFEIINFCCVIFRNIRHRSEFIFEDLWAEFALLNSLFEFVLYCWYEHLLLCQCILHLFTPGPKYCFMTYTVERISQSITAMYRGILYFIVSSIVVLS